MRAIPGGRYIAGSDLHYAEERPAHAVTVAPFRMDAAPVTVAEFARFVAATGHVTLAERPPDPAAYPGAESALLVPGSTVFTPPPPGGTLRFWGDWWRYVPGACWRRPDGAADARAGHPVVHVAHADAAAYAAWAGKTLPSEAEWEWAAWGGTPAVTEYAWGEEMEPGGTRMANTWQGRFPFGAERGGTSPVGAFPANGYGLYDMIGNVWEWTADRWTADHAVASPCCTPPGGPAASFTIKGGSHLCAPSYCRRYRPAARQGQAADSGTSHIGFRCVSRSA